MAEGGSDEVVEKIVCGLCSGEYNQTKLLPCFHSYCIECLENYVEKNVRSNKFDCPLCDTTIEIPEGGVNQFEWNNYLDNKLKSETLEHHGCDLCGSGIEGVDHCTDCEENYCERCSEIHLRQRATRMHTLIAISDSMPSGPKAIKRKAFCAKHPKEEIKVVCKDCEKMLCIVCKLTDHEKHNTVDISDEIVYVKKKLNEAIQKAENTISKSKQMLINLNAAKAESCKNKDNTLKELRDYGTRLKQQIDRRICAIELSVSNQCNDTCKSIESLSADTEKNAASLTNITRHARQMASVCDISILATVTGTVRNQLEVCSLKANLQIDKGSPAIFCDLGRHLTMLTFYQGFKQSNLFTFKTVTKLNEVLYSKLYSENHVCSISVADAFSAWSFQDSKYSRTITSQSANIKFVKTDCYCLLCTADNKIFFSHTANKEIKCWDISRRTFLDVHKSRMYPHGIAHRFNNGHEELVVCFLTNETDVMSTAKRKGTVKALPLEGRNTPYDFIAETSPAPTRVAVSKLDGLVCLAYPSTGQISMYTKDGHVIHCFSDGKPLVVDQRLIRPFGICFDNENCIVIADRADGKVIRVSLLGKVIQTLVKGGSPTAVGVGSDDKLWVGYEDKNVTVFQMRNEDPYRAVTKL